MSRPSDSIQAGIAPTTRLILSDASPILSTRWAAGRFPSIWSSGRGLKGRSIRPHHGLRNFSTRSRPSRAAGDGMESDCRSESITFDLHDLESLISYRKFVLAVKRRGLRSRGSPARFPALAFYAAGRMQSDGCPSMPPQERQSNGRCLEATSDPASTRRTGGPPDSID